MNADPTEYPGYGRHPAFVDSNILLYAHDQSAGEKRRVARDLIQTLWEERSGRLSIQVLQEFFVNATRKLSRPLETADAREVISDYAYWPVHRPGTVDVLSAIDLHRGAQISFWDAMILTSAVAQGCNVLYSEDLGDGQYYGGVRVINPFTPNSGRTDQPANPDPGEPTNN
ncbi:MAG: PIN domain-containing protein [Rubrobacteraceae bacterium]